MLPTSLRKERGLSGHKGRVFDLRWSPEQPSRIAACTAEAVGPNRGAVRG